MIRKSILLVGFAAAALAGYVLWQTRGGDHAIPVAEESRAVVAPAKAAPAVRRVVRLDTAHYAITSTATEAQAKRVGAAVEALHDAYFAFFRDSLGDSAHDRKLQLTLYKDQQEFKRNNRSSPWAEAYYLRPTCFAYFAEGERNPYHWMLHEATHQLNTEVAGLRLPRWANEGLANYFGSSQLRDGRLVPGTIDADTYPIWWLPTFELTGDLPVDVATGNIVPLRALVSGIGGPDIAQAVNKYYVGYWSLTHFLFHYDNGRYADGYRKVIAAGGTLAQFEQEIGPIERIEVEWHGYLRKLVADPQE